MCSARDAIATTSLVAVRDVEKGLDGRGIIEGTESGVLVRWMWSVESHEADIKIESSLL